MKRAFICSMLVLFARGAQAERDGSDKKVGFYAGIGLSDAITSSESTMDREINQMNIPGSGHTFNQKSNMNHLGCNLCLGATFGTDCFVSPEFAVNFQHKKVHRAFLDTEDIETGAARRIGAVVSHLDVKYGNSYQFLLKAGKQNDSYKFYGIAGWEVRSIDVNYQSQLGHRGFVAGESFGANYKKNIGSLVLGLGTAKKLTDRVDLVFEYKFKPYTDAKYIKNMIEDTGRAIGGVAGDADTTARNFKTKQSQHEFSLGVVINF